MRTDTTATTSEPLPAQPRLYELALAAVGALVLHPAADAHQEVGYLRSQQQSVAQWGEWGQVLLGTLRTPAPGDSHLLDLAADLDLSAFEILTIALAAAVENESFVGRTLSRVQSPVGGASQRLVVAPGREAEGIFQMPGGQSGHPLSPHYRDGHAAWEQGLPTPFLPGPALHRLQLVPAAGATPAP